MTKNNNHNLIEQIKKSSLKELFNSTTHWSSSLADTKKKSVWVSLSSKSSQNTSSLKYLNSKKIKELRGILMEGNKRQIYNKYSDLIQKIKQRNNQSQSQLQFFISPKVRENLAIIANSLYPIQSIQLSQFPKLIAVTGTNGKTSICLFINQIINQVVNQTKKGYQAATFYSGTLGIGEIRNEKINQSNIYQTLEKLKLTTPDILNFYFHLKKFVDKGGEFGACELSSHALAQNRLLSVHFETAIFSNISHDHLDYHPNLNHYFAAKCKLLNQDKLKNVILNLADFRLYHLAGKLNKTNQSQQTRLITISTNKKFNQPQFNNTAHFFASKIKLTSKGSEFILHYFDKQGKEQTERIKTSLFGKFNIENLLLSAAGVMSLNQTDFNFKTVSQSLETLKPVTGRIEKIHSQRKKYKKLEVFVDYAHSPDALKNILISLKKHFKNRYLICIFGAGGNRDQTKRAPMGQIVNQLTDEFIITSDNSRDEPFEKIASDIAFGIKNLRMNQESLATYQIIESRKKAINEGLKSAIKHQAVILIAGKGHEDSQTINGKTFKFSDIQYLTKKIN